MNSGFWTIISQKVIKGDFLFFPHFLKWINSPSCPCVFWLQVVWGCGRTSSQCLWTTSLTRCTDRTWASQTWPLTSVSEERLTPPPTPPSSIRLPPFIDQLQSCWQVHTRPDTTPALIPPLNPSVWSLDYDTGRLTENNLRHHKSRLYELIITNPQLSGVYIPPSRVKPNLLQPYLHNVFPLLCMCILTRVRCCGLWRSIPVLWSWSSHRHLY